MLDIGFPEFLLISFVLLIVVGPKDNSEIDEIKDVENELNMKSLKKDLNKINDLSSNKIKKNK